MSLAFDFSKHPEMLNPDIREMEDRKKYVYKRVYSVPDIGVLLGMNERTVRSFLKEYESELKPQKLGRSLRVDAEIFDEWYARKFGKEISHDANKERTE